MLFRSGPPEPRFCWWLPSLECAPELLYPGPILVSRSTPLAATDMGLSSRLSLLAELEEEEKEERERGPAPPCPTLALSLLL